MIQIDKNNLLAFTLFAALIIFLSCPYIAKADASVNGFFPKNFVTEGFFKEDTVVSLSKSKLPKPDPAKLRAYTLPNREIVRDKCKEQPRQPVADSFAIPEQWINCNTHKYSQY